MSDAYTLAQDRRERGIVSSILHAEREDRGWAERAYAALVMYAGAAGDRPFTIEDFRTHDPDAIGPPPDLRAWGGVTQRAVRNGVLRRVGFAAALSSNGSPKPLYVCRKKPGRPPGSPNKKKRKPIPDCG